MNVKRILTTVVGLPLVVLFIIYANTLFMDILLTIVALIAMHEYITCCSSKEEKVIKWIAYLSCFFILVFYMVPSMWYLIFICGVPLLLIILFSHIIFTDGRITFPDVAVTLLGIIYVVGSIFFISLIFDMNHDAVLSGKYIIWYVMLAAWGTDIFAYIIGMKFGKHKFSKISPKKSIEGCIAGVVATVIISLIYTYFINKNLGLNISLVIMGIISIVLSIVGQIGDFSASTIKRYYGIKDYSNLFPGHGGMLDRIDSMMFIAPVTFLLFTLIIV